MRVYIAGPITKNPEYMSDFQAAENMLRSRGYEVINPAKLTHAADCLTYREYMKLCYKLLGMADCLYTLKGFERSPGAMCEYNRAQCLFKIKHIWHEDDGVPPEVTYECRSIK